MKWWTKTLAGLALLAGLVLFVSARHGQAQGPGQEPFPNYPFAPVSPSQPVHPLLKGLEKSSPSTSGAHPKEANSQSQPDEPEPNQDIKVTAKAGDWMICVHTYKGPEAHQMARQMVSVLRAKPYELWAYVYNFTSDARHQHEVQNKQIIEKYKQLMKLTGQTKLNVRLPSFKIEDEVGILVGGYKDMETARRALTEIKKLPMPDPKLVKLDKMWIFEKDDKQAKEMFVNPLASGMVVRNPTAPKQNVKDSPYDLAVLKRLNSDEPLTLLKNPRKFSLAIKEYRLPVYIRQNSSLDINPLKKTGLVMPSNNNPEDPSAHNAHTLAEWLRSQYKVEAYVLHTQTSSVVTIGAFDNLEDPQVKTLQQRIGTIHNQFAQLAQQNPQFDGLQIFPIGFPMQVPR